MAAMKKHYLLILLNLILLLAACSSPISRNKAYKIHPVQKTVVKNTVIKNDIDTLTKVSEYTEVWTNENDWYGDISLSRFNEQNVPEQKRFSNHKIAVRGSVKKEGVKVLTNPYSGRQPKYILGQLAGSLEYWIGRETARLFKEKIVQTNEVDLLYIANPKLSGDAFDFGTVPFKRKNAFKSALRKNKEY